MNLIIEILKAIVLGVVEGITEWLPISSTGHMILVDEFLHLNVTPQFKEMFLVVIQLGAILAVVVLYWHKLWPFGIENKRIVPKKDIWQMWFKIHSIGELTYTSALIIGAFQLIAAVFPGTSRSGATILGAILIGVSRTVAAEYTFFLAVPVMFGASALKLVKFGFHFTSAEAILLAVGMIVAFVVSILTIKFLMGYIKKHDFKAFGWYRIVLGAAVILYFVLAR